MVESSASQLDLVFHALSHPARRDILRRIAVDECTVTQLAAPYAMSLEAVSKHIQVLERAHLLRRTRSGRVHHCRLDPTPIRDASQVLRDLSALWNRRLDALEHLLATLSDEE